MSIDLFFSVFFLVLAFSAVLFLYQLATGKAYTQRLAPVERAKEPGMYWFLILGNGGSLLIMLIIVGVVSTTWSKLSDSPNPNKAPTARPAFNPISFLAEPTPASTTCATANDITYGYSETNPIRIGGGQTKGSQRAAEYLSNLRRVGVDTALAFEHGGYILTTDTSLHFFQIQEETGTRTVYMDFYSYQQPQALRGYTCALPLSFNGP